MVFIRLHFMSFSFNSSHQASKKRKQKSMTGGRNSLYCLKTTFFLLILYRLLYVVISWFVFQMFPLFKISSSLKSAKTSGFLPTLPRKKTSYVKTPGVPSWRNASGYTNSLGEKTAGYTGRPLGHSHGNLGTCYVIQEIYGHIQYYLVGGFKHDFYFPEYIGNNN